MAKFRQATSEDFLPSTFEENQLFVVENRKERTTLSNVFERVFGIEGVQLRLVDESDARFGREVAGNEEVVHLKKDFERLFENQYRNAFGESAFTLC